MATTMNISLSDDLRAFVEQQVHEHAFGSTSEYVRDLIRKQRDIAKLRGLLLEGATSAKEGDFDAGYFSSLREQLGEHATTRAKSR